MNAAIPFLVATALVAGQVPQPPRLVMPRLPQAPSMARDADLSTWAGALVVDDFGMIMPDDKGENRWRTVAHLAWGPDAVYVAMEAFDPEPSQVRGWPHKRDDFGDQELAILDLDPSGKGQSCLRLIVTPLGGQMDAIVQDSKGEDFSYDCLWDSAGVRTPQGYVVKFRVPYSSLRRMPGDWGVRLLRIIPRERRFGITWPRMSRDIQCDICQMAKVSGAPVEKPGSPFLLIPFAAASREESLERATLGRPEVHHRLGLDLRYSSTSLTLDGTYRPDFSNIEADVDPLQINSRFRVLYQEKRPFFLEGTDLLGVEGAQRQFFSRSIIDPLYGLKASGQASWASWSLLTAKDQGGGVALGYNGASGVDALPTRDTIAAMRFRTDSRGSAITLLGTDRLLLGGPEASGGRSGGVYVDQYLGTEWHVIASGIRALSRLPQADGTVAVSDGSAASAELDWNNRNWGAAAWTNATSPGLVLVSGFSNLQGYRTWGANVSWRERWNAGRFAQASVNLSYQNYQWWDAAPMDHMPSLNAYLETVGRWSANVSLTAGGRSWAEGRSVGTRGVTLNVAWRRHGYFQAWTNERWSRTIDLETGDAAILRRASVGANGNLSAFGYEVSAQDTRLDREADGACLIRARQVTGTAGWQLPRHFYVRTQGFVVWYDQPGHATTERYAKLLVGWQPNAFTQAYLGWSTRRKRDPLDHLEREQMTDRGLFAKVAYAFQF